MFARIKMCFVVGRDRTPNAAAHRNERENGSFQGQLDARVPRGNRGRPLADRQLHRKRQISLVSHHLCENKPGVGRQPEPAFGRIATAQCRPHRANQKGIGSQAKGEIKNRDSQRNRRLRFANFSRLDFLTINLLSTESCSIRTSIVRFRPIRNL